MLVSQNVVVFFNKDHHKTANDSCALDKDCFFGGGNTFWKTVEVALQKTSRGRGGGGRGLHDCLRLPRLLTTNTRQLEILVTTLPLYH